MTEKIISSTLITKAAANLNVEDDLDVEDPSPEVARATLSLGPDGMKLELDEDDEERQNEPKP